jgi:hypothetical protein
MRKRVPGRISNIRFLNVALDGATEKKGYHIWIKGEPGDHSVSDVTFEGVTWFGQPLQADSAPVKIEGNTSNIRFRAAEDRP